MFLFLFGITLVFFLFQVAGDVSEELVEFFNAFVEFAQLGFEVLVDFADLGSESLVEFAKSGVGFFVHIDQFALGLLAKPMLVTLPCVLLLLD